MTTDGNLCGWRVRSELPLPELARWNGDDRAPDIHVRLGAVPERLEGGVACSPFVQVDSAKRECLLTLPDVAAFHVRGPDEVVIAAGADATETEIRLFLLGSVLGFLCHLRGLFPLHASCVALGGKAVAFSGPSGAGKSTTALHLARRGHGLVADDVCVVDMTDVPTVLPAFPRLKLWGDTLASVGVGGDGLERNRPGQDKYHYRFPDRFDPEPVPLAAIFLLSRADPGTPARLDRLTAPLDIIPAIAAEIFRPLVARQLGRDRELLAAQAKIAGSVPVYRLSRPFDAEALDSWLDMVEAVVAA